MATIVFADTTKSYDGRDLEATPLGGTETSVIRVVRELARRGHDVFAQVPYLRLGLDLFPGESFDARVEGAFAMPGMRLRGAGLMQPFTRDVVLVTTAFMGSVHLPIPPREERMMALHRTGVSLSPFDTSVQSIRTGLPTGTVGWARAIPGGGGARRYGLAGSGVAGAGAAADGSRCAAGGAPVFDSISARRDSA